jgi:hypothetical protein
MPARFQGEAAAGSVILHPHTTLADIERVLDAMG